VVAEVLATFEYEQSAKRIEELRGKPISGRFDQDPNCSAAGSTALTLRP
jgi:hypothetical protein